MSVDDENHSGRDTECRADIEASMNLLLGQVLSGDPRSIVW
ncbi:hypothetical protein EDF27_0551 [Curtobacterium sp. PhB136]|nr:hypothetical protein EDF27_0551 [Curtobacterium sp. PhB136]